MFVKPGSSVKYIYIYSIIAYHAEKEKKEWKLAVDKS